MKRITKLALVILGVAGLAALGTAGMQAFEEAAPAHILKLDVACDCRTGAQAFFGGNRCDVFIVNGKIFPAGTLPAGTASNDPTQPVNGIAPIGDWMCRGQLAMPFSPEIAPAYSSTPPFLNTQYFIFHDKRALTVEGYAIPTGELLSVTGGIGGFRGASGFIEEEGFGTNVTGCPNFHAKFRIRIDRGSERD
jgi:hypothetical protein